MPWEECPKGHVLPIWRYSKNPIIKIHPNKSISRAFNSALVPFKNEFIGVFRGDGNNDMPKLYVGHSKDGINIDIDDKAIEFVDEKGKKVPDTEWQYDPRVIPLEGAYYIVWCDEFVGPTIAIAKTKDFKKFVKLDRPFLPCNRNGVLFPRKINGLYAMLSRPSDTGHTAFGDIYVSYSKDLTFWGKHQLVAKSGPDWWCNLKIGAGPVPIETDKGWLLFTHGVGRNCNGYVYSISAMLLDINNPGKVIARCKNYMLTPEEDYEHKGFVPNVCFPTACLVDKSGKIAIYYGAADTYTALAFTTVDKVINYLMEHKL